MGKEAFLLVNDVYGMIFLLVSRSQGGKNQKDLYDQQIAGCGDIPRSIVQGDDIEAGLVAYNTTVVGDGVDGAGEGMRCVVTGSSY